MLGVFGHRIPGNKCHEHVLMTDYSNRRLSTRRRPKVRIRVVCRKGALDLGPNVAESLLDVSEEGARLLLNQPLLVNQEVTVGLEGPNHRRPVLRVGIIVWSVPAADGGYCVGVTFEKRLPYRDLLYLVQV
jgi:PilZ domain